MIVPVLMLAACGGKVTDEQRQQMREARERQAIVKVTEAELMEAAFEKGRVVVATLKNDPVQIAPVAQQQAVKINWLVPGAQGLEIEQQLIDAYLNSLLSDGNMQDNVQFIGTDSVLYTNPVVNTRADSSIEITGTWNVWMSRKQLVLSMHKK